MNRWLWAAVCVAALLGCGTKNTTFDAGAPPGDADVPFEASLACNGDCDAEAGLAALDVQPQNAVLDVVDGAIKTQAFTVTRMGLDVTAQVSWSFDKPLMGDVASAVFTPSGKIGGVGTVRASLPDALGSATITVRVARTVSNNLGPAQKTALDNPSMTPDPSTLVYPSDGTYFPLDVLGPELQWNGTSPTDTYRLRLTEKYFTYTEYFTAASARHLIADADWTALTYSGSGALSDPMTVEITRASGSVVYAPKKSTWHVAQGKLRGMVYYWELPDACGSGDGRIVRLKPGQSQVEEFYKPGVCWGCHSVSRDGRTMMAAFQTTVPQTQRTVDLSKSPAQDGKITQSSGVQGTFSAFNPAGDKILVATDTGNPQSSVLRILDANTASVLNADVLGSACGDPAWSPDGKRIAAVCNIQGGNWLHLSTLGGDLVYADVVGNKAMNKKTVPALNAPGRPAFPSFAPSSDLLAYAWSSSGGQSTGVGDLYVADVMGGKPKKLAAASDGRSFNPVFAPLRAGGYSWIAFVSRRDYGNHLVGANRQQIWVTAVDDPPSAADPSHPPFYLRGQEECGKSENAQFALEPCKQKGASCESGFDCCAGQCTKDPMTQKYVCGDPPSGCSQLSNACKTGADCCDVGALCVDGFCQMPAPK